MVDALVHWRALFGKEPFPWNPRDGLILRDKDHVTAKHREMLERPFEAAAPIADLSKDWRHKINVVQKESAKDIAGYRKALNTLKQAQGDVANARKHDSEKSNKKAAALNIAIYEARIAMKQHWHRLEMRLAQTFCQQLVAICAAENPQQFILETGHLGNPSEIQAYALNKLEDTIAQPIPSYLNRQTHLSLKTPVYVEEPQAHERIERGRTNPVSAERLDCLDAAHATAKQPTHEEGTPLSLADTINGIWAETTHPRLRQPTTPQTLPHIYSIIEELLGHTKEIADAEPLAMKPWSERTQNGSASGTSQSLAK